MQCRNSMWPKYVHGQDNISTFTLFQCVLCTVSNVHSLTSNPSGKYAHIFIYLWIVALASFVFIGYKIACFRFNDLKVYLVICWDSQIEKYNASSETKYQNLHL